MSNLCLYLLSLRQCQCQCLVSVLCLYLSVSVSIVQVIFVLWPFTVKLKPIHRWIFYKKISLLPRTATFFAEEIFGKFSTKPPYFWKNSSTNVIIRKCWQNNRKKTMKNCVKKWFFMENLLFFMISHSIFANRLIFCHRGGAPESL